MLFRQNLDLLKVCPAARRSLLFLKRNGNPSRKANRERFVD